MFNKSHTSIVKQSMRLYHNAGTAGKATAPNQKLRGPSGTSYFPFAYIDLRSDTVTRPCEKMRDAMANAVVGDDIYFDCPTTNKL